MKRLPLPDLLKGFAVFLIVPVHILELFIDYPGRESSFGKILLFLGGPVAVPVFMIIMGYFMAKNKKPLATNLSRGLKVFAVGFLLNIGLNLHLLLKIKFAGWPYNPLEYLFGVDILYFAGIALIFLSFLKLIKKGKAWIAYFLFFAVIGLTSYMNNILMLTERNYLVPFIAGDYSWSYFPLFPWLAYPLLGFALANSEAKVMGFLRGQKLVSGILLAVIAAMVLFFSKSGFTTTIYLPAYYHHTFWFSLWAMGLVILWVLAIRFLILKFPETLVGNFLMWLGKNITVFYVVQWLIIGNIATAIYQTQTIGTYIFWYTGIFAVTVFLTWLLEKTQVKLAS
ncbi:MAG: acyltransferase [Prolixibacteraceae bacterium]|jgi:uncharacterized membrane protein